MDLFVPKWNQWNQGKPSAKQGEPAELRLAVDLAYCCFSRVHLDQTLQEPPLADLFYLDTR